MSIAKTKRFLERWMGDAAFRALFLENPAQTVKDYGFDVKPEEVALLCDREAIKEHGDRPLPSSVIAYRDFIQQKKKHREQIRLSSAPLNERFRKWRQRQMVRSTLELGRHRSEAIIHAPFTVELCQGCSVGCWFCGVSAKSFKGYLPYTKENAHLWQEILKSLKEVIGQRCAGNGFCYWGTDPFDNADYEKFALDFRNILGRLPQVTTAQASRDLDRTAKYLQFSKANGGFVERFSVLTRRAFEQIMEYFTPEELLNVELILQFDNTKFPKALAGKARQFLDKRKAQGKAVPAVMRFEEEATIACVSGFLINLQNKTLELISPCIADDNWPEGYLIFARRKFSDAQDFKQKLQDMIAKDMRISLAGEDVLQLSPHFRFEAQQNTLHCRYKDGSLSIPYVPFLDSLFPLLQQGDLTAKEIALSQYRNKGIDPVETFQSLNDLFQRGLFAEILQKAPTEKLIQIGI
ncbi:MAG: radical SAM family RiPP maturation amino acid epimerase [Simkaniaceae bacterium]